MGFVKTRLQHPQFSPEFPSQLQTAMLLDTILVLRFLPETVVPVVTYYPEDSKSIFEKLIIEPIFQIEPKLRYTLHFISQKGNTFDDRFKNAFKYTFQDLNLSSALIIGSDTPHIQPSLLRTAIEILQSDKNNSVLGPSQEGGFYLLGHNEPYIDTIGTIFTNPSSFKELENAMDLLLSISNMHILPKVTDVDYFEDLLSVRSIINLLYSNFKKGENIYLPKHTLQLINSLNVDIWDS